MASPAAAAQPRAGNGRLAQYANAYMNGGSSSSEEPPRATSLGAFGQESETVNGAFAGDDFGELEDGSASDDDGGLG